MKNIKLFNGDCLEEYKQIDRESVDLILVDPPYGNMNTEGGERIGIKGWDIKIPPHNILKLADHTLREGGRMVIFSQEPYTSELITSTYYGINFNQRAVWIKDGFANHLGVNKNLVSYFEDILIFTKRGSKNTHSPVKDIMAKYTRQIGREKIIELFISEGRYSSEASARKNASYSMGFSKGRTFQMIDVKMYEHLKKHIQFKESYNYLHSLHKEYKASVQPTFNLGDKTFISNVFNFPREREGYHPTQKPVKLLEELMGVYSNPGDVVLDFTMGSGSTGVACRNLDRKFIGIELDEEYFEIAKKRIGNVE